MNKPNLIPVTESIVDEKVIANEPFTAYDITVEVRSRGHRIGHKEVKDAVHDYYARGGFGVAYSRTIISIFGENPYLYHRIKDDPSSYLGAKGIQTTNNQAVDTSSQAVVIPSNLLNNLSSNVSQNSGVANSAINGHARNSATRTVNSPGTTKNRIVDGRGTLSIPTTIIRQIGFKPHQKVYAVASTNSVDIIATKPSDSTVYGTYTVDNHQQVRLTQTLLQRAGIAGNQYDIEQGSDKVIVKLSN